MTKKTTSSGLLHHLNETNSRSVFLALSDLEKLDDAADVLVDAALVCARLQIIKMENDSNNNLHLIHEIESILYKTKSLEETGHRTRVRLTRNRVSMSVGEVRSFFGVIKALSPLAIMSCGIP